MFNKNLLRALLVIVFLTACTSRFYETPSGITSGGGAAVTPVGADTRVTPPPRPTIPIVADLVLRSEQNSGTFTLGLNQTLAIVLEPGMEWEATYDANLLQLQEHTQRPEAEVWMWRSIQAGTTQIRLTTKMPTCPAGEPCSAMPVGLFVVALTIR